MIAAPSVAFLIEVAAIDSAEAPSEVPRTAEVIPAVGLLRRTP